MINSEIDHQIDPNRDQFDGDQFPHPAAEKFVKFPRFPPKPLFLSPASVISALKRSSV